MKFSNFESAKLRSHRHWLILSVFREYLRNGMERWFEIPVRNKTNSRHEQNFDISNVSEVISVRNCSKYLAGPYRCPRTILFQHIVGAISRRCLSLWCVALQESRQIRVPSCVACSDIFRRLIVLILVRGGILGDRPGNLDVVMLVERLFAWVPKPNFYAGFYNETAEIRAFMGNVFLLSDERMFIIQWLRLATNHCVDLNEHIRNLAGNPMRTCSTLPAYLLPRQPRRN